MTNTVIKCDSVYKIFGTNAKKMLQEANGNVDAKTFQENGCIVGVNNASFEVSKGEMLVVMGLSGSGKSTLLRCISRLTDASVNLEIHLNNVDFPDPDKPITTNISPFETSKEALFTPTIHPFS